MNAAPASSPLLARLEATPFLRIERCNGHAALYFQCSDRAIGTVDLRTGVLTIDVNREVVGPLLARHPRFQATAGGVRCRATGASADAAQALLRWRIDLELFAPQFRVASP